MADKWYVNIPAADGQPQGPKVKLVAKRDGKKKAGAAKSKAKWAVTHDGARHAGFSSFEPAFEPAITEETADDSFAHEFTFPQVGAVTYTLTAGKTGFFADKVQPLTKQYQAVRKLYVTINYMNQRCLTLFNEAEAAIKETLLLAGIELHIAEKLAQTGGLDEPVSVRTSADMVFAPRNAGALTHGLQHFRVHLVNDVGSLEDLATLTGRARGEANDFEFDAGARKLVLHTRKKQSRIYKRFKVKSLSLQASLNDVAIAADRVAKTGDSTFTVQLSDEQWAAVKSTSGVMVKANLHGKKAEFTLADVNLEVSKAATSIVPLKTGKEGNQLKVWLEGERIHLEALDGRTFGEPPCAAPGAHPSIQINSSGAMLRAEDAVTRASPTKVTIDLSKFAGTVAAAAAGKKLKLACKLRLVKAAGGGDVTVAFKGDNGEKLPDLTVQYLEASKKVHVSGPLLLKQAGGVTDVSVYCLGPVLDFSDDECAAVTQNPAALGATPDLKFEIPLAGVPRLRPSLDALVGGGQVIVKLTYTAVKSLGGYYFANPAGGSDKKTCVLTAIVLAKKDAPAEDEEAAHTQRRMKYAFLHELAHALKVVKGGDKNGAVFEKKGASNVVNQLFYQENGGQGEHCSHTVKKTPGAYEATTPQPAGTKLCIMFHNIVVDRECEFCPVCLGQLQRTKVEIPAGG